ncbi:MAG: KH domain-containing protein [Bdellovibrionota bacterium]
MKELVEEIARALVDKPEDVCVEESSGNHTFVLKVRVSKEDVGKVIGKKGSNANAIRTILDASGGKNNRRYILEILE